MQFSNAWRVEFNHAYPTPKGSNEQSKIDHVIIGAVMVKFTTAERVIMVEQFNQTNSNAQTRINYQVEFPNGRVPSRKAIRLNVLKYHQHGTSLKYE